jgi:small subunit ribosomal protein S6
MRERRRDYELMYIISPLRSSEEEIAATVNRINQTIINLGGEITSVNQAAPWGRRKFAYAIRDYAEGEASRRVFNEGYYVLCYFKLGTTQMIELERTIKLTDAILRHMIVLDETALTLPAERRGAVAEEEPVEVDEEPE